jgi:hypothetical protein
MITQLCGNHVQLFVLPTGGIDLRVGASRWVLSPEEWNELAQLMSILDEANRDRRS